MFPRLSISFSIDDLSGQAKTLPSAADAQPISFRLDHERAARPIQLDCVQPHTITHGFTEDQISLSSGAVTVESNATPRRIQNTAA